MTGSEPGMPHVGRIYSRELANMSWVTNSRHKHFGPVEVDGAGCRIIKNHRSTKEICWQWQNAVLYVIL